MNKYELINILKEIDWNASTLYSGKQLQEKVKVVIIGGGALILNDLSLSGSTSDIDIFQITGANENIRKTIFADPRVNGMCQAYSLDIPYNFEDRLIKVDLNTNIVDFFILSQEDLAVMKLYRWAPPDISDLMSREFLATLNWKVLEHLVYDPDEAAGSRVALPEQDSELKQMRANFEDYRKRCNK